MTDNPQYPQQGPYAQQQAPYAQQQGPNAQQQVAYGQQAPQPAPMAGARGPGRWHDLFAMMDGTPAHIAVLLGLLLVLLSPVISRSHAARAEAAAAELEHAQALMALDLEEYDHAQAGSPAASGAKAAKMRVQVTTARRDSAKKVLEAKAQKLRDLRSGGRGMYPPDAAQQKAVAAVEAEVEAAQKKVDELDNQLRDEEIQGAEAAAKALESDGGAKAREDKQQQLEKQYRVKELQRAEVDARTASKGTTLALHLGWMGRLLLLASLLVLALSAQGAKQKILAILAVVALVSWVTPFGVELFTGTRAGPPPNATPLPTARPGTAPAAE